MSDAEGSQTASGSWQPDPTGRYKLRWRDEAGAWTDHVYSSEGEMGNDPYDAPPPPPPSQSEEHAEQPVQPQTKTPTKAEARNARTEAKKAELRQRLADQKSFKKSQQEAVKSASGMDGSSSRSPDCTLTTTRRTCARCAAPTRPSASGLTRCATAS